MTTLYLEAGLRHRLQRCLLAHQGERALVVVSDVHSWRACGFGQAPPFTPRRHWHYPAPPRGDLATAEALAASLESQDCVLVIGSGTLNDLTKYAAWLRGVPYLVLATAPSMNGYVSPTASLYDAQGAKSSRTAAPPGAVFADSEILAAAPRRLLASGLGDSLCRATITTDLNLAHHCTDAPDYRARMAHLAREEERTLEALAAWPPGAPAPLTYIEALFRWLMSAGEAMQEAGSSAPASQSEHMLAHVLEILAPRACQNWYHGELIARTTLRMARWQRRCYAAMARRLSQKPETLQPLQLPPFPNAVVARYVGEATARRWREAYRAKQAALKTAPARHLPKGPAPACPRTLADHMRRGGCLPPPNGYGISTATDRLALYLARFSRERFTYLDLLPEGNLW